MKKTIWNHQNYPGVVQGGFRRFRWLQETPRRNKIDFSLQTNTQTLHHNIYIAIIITIIITILIIMCFSNQGCATIHRHVLTFSYSIFGLSSPWLPWYFIFCISDCVYFVSFGFEIPYYLILPFFCKALSVFLHRRLDELPCRRFLAFHPLHRKVF